MARVRGEGQKKKLQFFLTLATHPRHHYSKRSNTIASSADLGETWTGQGTAVFSTRGNEVAWNDKRWVIAGTGTNTVAYSNDGATWWPCVGASMFTEGVGIGSNPKIGLVTIRSAVVLNSRDKVCVNTPIYYDSDVANDTSLVFNLNI